MIIKPNDKKIKYTGRWNVKENIAESTANGNYFDFSFKGDTAVIAFDTTRFDDPIPHIYISVDDGAKIASPVDKYVRISCDSGSHTVRVIMKSSMEAQQRWYHPLESRCSLLGIDADEFLEMPEDNRKKIEFIGDSITEGIAIDDNPDSYYANEGSIIYSGDSTAGYAWLTAEKLNLRPYIMCYGGLSITRFGNGNVPNVRNSYPFYSDGCPMESINADYIVINHGTNDRKADKEVFKREYFEFLRTVRDRNKNSKIISVTPFPGCLAKEIEESVTKYNKEFNDDVFYINSAGWVTPEPLHPTREGHKIISEKLAEIFKKHIL